MTIKVQNVEKVKNKSENYEINHKENICMVSKRLVKKLSEELSAQGFNDDDKTTQLETCMPKL